MSGETAPIAAPVPKLCTACKHHIAITEYPHPTKHRCTHPNLGGATRNVVDGSISGEAVDCTVMRTFPAGSITCGYEGTWWEPLSPAPGTMIPILESTASFVARNNKRTDR